MHEHTRTYARTCLLGGAGTGPPVYRGRVPFNQYKVTVGVKLSSQPLSAVKPIGTFDCNKDPQGALQLLFDASTRASERVRSEASDFFEILAELDKQTPTLHGRTPTQTPVYANTFGTPEDTG